MNYLLVVQVILHTFLWLSLCHILALKAIELNGLKRLFSSDELLLPNVELAKLFDYKLINDRINGSVRDFLKKAILLNDHSFHIIQKMHTMTDDNISSSDMGEVKSLLQKYVTERANETLNDLNKIQNSVQAPFAYCYQ
ncbi:unnamed protein product [Wuchereria bancrofti]|uniref:Uncharacterized protein n=1 Tax=Wuchereria bancrofti TaxID=6293 RepID=A0A3P7E825_WUCBA|nr:unnamed protein product [Wuchereria bancrofti]